MSHHLNADFILLRNLEKYLQEQNGDTCVVAGSDQVVSVMSRSPVSGVTSGTRSAVDMLLMVNITMRDDLYHCQLVTFNKMIVKTVKVAPDSVENVLDIVDEVTRSRYQLCPGLGVSLENENIFLNKLKIPDLKHILIDKYNGQVIYRSRICKFVITSNEIQCIECKSNVLSQSPSSPHNINSGSNILSQKLMTELEKQHKDQRNIINYDSRLVMVIEENLDNANVSDPDDIPEDYTTDIPKKIPNVLQHLTVQDKKEGSHPKLLNKRKDLKTNYFNKNSAERFSCPICRKSFRRNQELQSHSLTHSGT